ncbi:MAG: hypothetical protein JJ894_16580 [Dinoroseobacter sp.]|nr:hypothetical protein [Dinoroseobacter sp.]
MRRYDNGPDATAVCVLLMDRHGHISGKQFALDFKSMRATGLTSLSARHLRAARRTLQAVGLVRLFGKHREGSIHQAFTLGRIFSCT